MLVIYFHRNKNKLHEKSPLTHCYMEELLKIISVHSNYFTQSGSVIECMMYVHVWTYSSHVYCVSEFFFVLHSRWGHLDIVKYLVNDAHCDPNVGDKDRETPLHLVCR